MLSIIIPTYNESKNIEKLILNIKKNIKLIKYEILIMDDNSPDGTGNIAKKLSKKAPVKVIIRTKDKGLANSVIDGFKHAKGDLVLVMDADLSHPPEDIPRILSAQKKSNADVIIASRLVEGGGTENWPNTRRITSYIAALLAKPLTKIRDPMSGFFLFKKEVIKNVNLSPLGYKILLEILVKGKYQKIIEMPYTFKDRTAGFSKLNMKVNLQYALHLFKLYAYKITNKL